MTRTNFFTKKHNNCLASSILYYNSAFINTFIHSTSLNEKYLNSTLYTFCETVINPLLYAFNEVNLEQTSFEEVAKIVGITEVNNCEIFNQDGLSGIRGLFPITSLMSHSCVPNCRVVQLQAKPNQSYCLALNPIQSGEELRISYVNLLMPTYMRRRHLAENWYFDCICERCQDVTEKGSYVGALKCSNCCDRFRKSG